VDIIKNNNFKGKVVFVTRAASGIGQATAIAFALEGAGVGGSITIAVESFFVGLIFAI